MKLLDKIKEKRNIIKEVDNYMHEVIEDVYSSLEMSIEESNDEYIFNENWREGEVHYTVDKKTLYDKCADLVTPEEIKDCIDSYIVGLSYEAQIEQIISGDIG